MYAVDLSDATWRKSSRSGGGSGNACIEVASAEATWRRSSRSSSNPNKANCVEVAFAGPAVAVRDSKDPDGPTLAFTPSSWSSFLRKLPGA